MLQSLALIGLYIDAFAKFESPFSPEQAVYGFRQPGQFRSETSIFVCEDASLYIPLAAFA
jgi:hypothetical protein